MTSTTLALDEVTRNAAEELESNGEKLCINKVYMWQNNMPRISVSGQAARKGQHMTVHIKRTKPDSSTLSNTPPVVTRLHAFQINSADQLAAFTSSSNLSGEGSNYFSWAVPSASSNDAQAGAVDETTARQQNVALVRPTGWRGYPDEIEIQAWDGPDWGAGKDFVAVVEFEGGLVLRSDVQTADTVC
ncbi:hypothetical protein M408DRAFT_26186 [Serendipita vermifera MAFF 305830]|uniref:Uncharacterized protein n=1 Tax=Serendipita vermifera MAFF 305830 TaxID=933852 RepID=A0A0C3ALC8_SERVB|nr:hypothetical protein M408DRAFT_26186 [Serendipita vermifera MAFF 305830]